MSWWFFFRRFGHFRRKNQWPVSLWGLAFGGVYILTLGRWVEIWWCIMKWTSLRLFKKAWHLPGECLSGQVIFMIAGFLPKQDDIPEWFWGDLQRIFRLFLTALGQWKQVYQKDWMIYHCLVNTVDGSCLNDFCLNGRDVDIIVKENWGEFYQKRGTWTQLDLKIDFFSTAKMVIFPHCHVSWNRRLPAKVPWYCP